MYLYVFLLEFFCCLYHVPLTAALYTPWTASINMLCVQYSKIGNICGVRKVCYNCQWDILKLSFFSLDLSYIWMLHAQTIRWICIKYDGSNNIFFLVNKSYFRFEIWIVFISFVGALSMITLLYKNDQVYWTNWW